MLANRPTHTLRLSHPSILIRFKHFYFHSWIFKVENLVTPKHKVLYASVAKISIPDCLHHVSALSDLHFSQISSVKDTSVHSATYRNHTLNRLLFRFHSSHKGSWVWNIHASNFSSRKVKPRMLHKLKKLLEISVMHKYR